MKDVGNLAVLIVIAMIEMLNPPNKDLAGVMPEIYYEILSDINAEDGEIVNDTEEVMYDNTNLPFIFKTIIYGKFDDIPWGELVKEEEIDYYMYEYQNKSIWQYVLRDLDLDGSKELIIRNEKGQIMVFYERWGEMEGAEGRMYLGVMGDDCCGVDAVLERKGSCNFYLNNGMHAGISSYQDNGSIHVRIETSRDMAGGGSIEGQSCEVYAIYDYGEYSGWLEMNGIEYQGDKKVMDQEGIFYFVEGKAATKELLGEWMLKNIWEEMIPSEEWVNIP